VLVIPTLFVQGCERPDPELIPDEYLQSELGLTTDDRVHTLSVSAAAAEVAEPDTVRIEPGDIVQFISADWFVHEVHFELDSMTAAARDFLLDTEQASSPPLLQNGSRFVLSFRDAPEGRYPYQILGNTAAGGGLIVVHGPEN
jgi:plastocyanin